MNTPTSEVSNSKKFRPNAIIKGLIFADGLVWAGTFVNSAIASVYLAEKLPVNAVQIIGLAYAIYLLSRSIPELFIARKLDREKGLTDEIKSSAIGAFLLFISYTSYIFISEPWHIYLLSVVNGIGLTLYLPAWRKMFALYLDKGQEAKENALYDMMEAGVGAVASILGGFIVEEFGTFTPVFIGTGVLALISSISLYVLGKRKLTKA